MQGHELAQLKDLEQVQMKEPELEPQLVEETVVVASDCRCCQFDFDRPEPFDGPCQEG